VFAVGFFFFHRHEILSGWDQMYGDRGDSRLVGFLLEHWYLVLHGTDGALSPPMFYPVQDTLGYSHALIGYLPLYLPLRWLGADPWTAQQVVFALTDVLNFTAALWLLWKVIGVERKLALFFAAFITFNSVKFNQIGHQQLQVLFYVLVAAGLAAKALQEAPQRRRLWTWAVLAMAALCLDLQLLTDVYNAWFLSFWAALWGLLALTRAESRAWLSRYRGKLALPAAGAMLVLGIGLIPFLLIYLPVQQVFGGWNYGVALEMVPRWYSFLSMGRGNWLWGWLPLPRGYPYAGEQRIGLGLAISIVSAIALARWRILPWIARSCLFATILFCVIAFRYGDTKSPWQLVHAIVPGAQSLRAVARYMIVLTIPLAIGLGVALTQRMATWSVRQRRVVWMLLVAAAIEQLGTSGSYSKSSERAYLASLRPQLSDRCQAFYTVTPPLRPLARSSGPFPGQFDAMWLALLTGIPTVNGYSGHFPPGWRLIDESAADYPLRVSDWIDKNGIQGTVCRVEVSP
jgi:hypothetical protein